MNYNTVDKAIYDNLPHKIGDTVIAHYGENNQLSKEGEIINIVGGNGGRDWYHWIVRCKDGTILAALTPDQVELLSQKAN